MFTKPEIGNFLIVSFRSAFLFSILLLMFAIGIFYGIYGLYEAFVAKTLVASSDDPIHKINSMTIPVVAVIAAIINLYFCVALLHFIWIKYRESQIITKSKVKDFISLIEKFDDKTNHVQKVYLNILVDYCRVLGVIDHPENNDTYLMSQMNSDKFNGAKVRFLSLVKMDEELANMPMLDFMNFKFSHEQKRRINDSLIMGSVK